MDWKGEDCLWESHHDPGRYRRGQDQPDGEDCGGLHERAEAANAVPRTAAGTGEG